MIPTIEQICDDLKARLITLEDALHWLEEHRKLAQQAVFNAE